MIATATERRRDRWARHLWAILLAIGVWLEVRGLRSGRKDDTLSEYTWSKTKQPILRGAAVGLTGWLVYHFSFGNGAPLSVWDLVFAGGGALLGVASTFRKTTA